MISINKVDRNKQEIQQELTGSGVTSDSELSLSCSSSEAVGLLPFLRGAAPLGGFLSLPGLLGRLMVILDLPEFIISLKNTMKTS